MGSEVIDHFFYEDKSLARSTLEGATYLYDNNILCDVGLIIEGKTIEAHKSILASASLYFRGMFCAGLKETGQREITIHDVDFRAMASVIRFFYTSCITLTEENIFDVVNVVDLLGVSSLHAACLAFLRRSITVRNCVSVYIICQLHGYHDVAQQAVTLACQHFSRLMELEEFLDMPLDMLLCCLDAKLLNVSSENSLLNKLCEWVKHDMDRRRDYLQRLLDHLNVYTLDLKQAESSLYQVPCVPVYSWLERAKHLRDRNITISSRNKQRFTKEVQVVLSCGGLTGGPIASVEALAVGDSMWRCMVPAASQTHGFRVLPPLKQPRMLAASAHTDLYVYIIGGRNDSGLLSSVDRYSVDANEWDEMVSLPEPLEGTAATVVNGNVYVTGGFSTGSGVTNKAWVLEAGSKSWRALPPMMASRSHHGLVAVNSYLYAIAGAGHDGVEQSSVERMSVYSGVWQPVPPLQEPRSHFGSVVLDNLIYVTGGLNAAGETLRSVQVYNTLTQEWATDSPLSIGRHSHGATVASGRIFIAAGSDELHQLSSCEAFTPHTHLWHCKPSLARTRVGPAMATIKVPVSDPPNI